MMILTCFYLCLTPGRAEPVDKLRERLTAQVRAVEKVAEAENGFFDVKPVFLLGEMVPGKSAYLVLREFRGDTPEQTRAKLKQAGASKDRLVAKFRGVLPDLERALGKPRWVVPGQVERLASEYSDTGIWDLSRSLQVLGQVEVLAGHEALAARHFFQSVQAAEKICQGGGNSLLIIMSGVAMRDGLACLLERLDKGTFTVQELKALSVLAGKLSFPREVLLHGLEWETLRFLLMMDGLEARKIPQSFIVDEKAPLNPVKEREAFAAALASVGPALSKLAPPSQAALDKCLKGSVAARALFPTSLDKQARIWHRGLVGLEAVRVRLALARFHLERGRYPADLKQLAPAYLAGPPQAKLQYRQAGQDYRLEGDGLVFHPLPADFRW